MLKKDRLNISKQIFDNMEDYGSEAPTELLSFGKNDISMLYDQSRKIMDFTIQFKELMMMYTCAMKEIQTRFEVLNAEFNVRNSRNPINAINTRLKRSSSIIEKMKRKSIDVSIDSIEENINDVAGIRVTCSYVDDIYTLSKALIKQKDIELVEQKDYIANPKPNGYRSLHMIVRVPVHFENEMKNVKVEVQIRTIAMDFWATLEHELKYKNRVENIDKVVNELSACANLISSADAMMLEIRQHVEKYAVEQTEEEKLIEQIKNLDHPII